MSVDEELITSTKQPNTPTHTTTPLTVHTEQLITVPTPSLTLDVNSYLGVTLPDHKWLIEGFIAKPSYVLLVGDGKSGKSTLAFQAALAVAHGVPFLGMPCTKGRVLYIQCDVSEFTWQLMLHNFQRAGEDLSGDVFFVNPAKVAHYLDVLTKQTVDYLKAIRDSCNPDMVVLDVLCELHRSDEQDSTSMRIVLNNILSVFHNVGLLIVHHSSKLNPDYPADPIRSSRGSSYIANRADNVALLNLGRLATRGRFGSPLNIPLRRKASGFWAL